MTTNIEVLMPFGEAAAEPGSTSCLAARRGTLSGATVGVVWNGWHCMRTIKNELCELLVRDWGAKAVVALQTGTTMPMTPQQLDAAQRDWDAAIIGLGT
jgi:hypothetical protein